MSDELKPMQWPSSVQLQWWRGEYADIRERIRRCGRLDRDEVWLPASDDGWQAFCREHGTYGFSYDWRELEHRERDAAERSRQRLAEQARLAQEQWDAERRKRQRAKDAIAEREWRAAETARQAVEQRSPQPAQVAQVSPTIEELKARALRYWSGVDAAYAQHQYHLVAVRKTLTHLYGTTFEAGHAYWVPTPVMFAIRGHGG